MDKDDEIETPDTRVSVADLKKAQKVQKALEEQLAAERARAADFEARFNAAEADKKAADLAQQPVEEQFRQRFNAIEQRLADERTARQIEVASAKAETQAYHLIAYRERVLREAGEEVVPSLVGGSTEEEIDESVEISKREYATVAARIAKRFQVAVPPPVEVTVEAPPPQARGGVEAPPPNAAYTAPPTSGGGFPTPTNALPIGVDPTQQEDVKEFTSEESVRSGRYGGDLRRQALEQVKRMASGGAGKGIGNFPRYTAQPTTVIQQMPSNVQQPQGTPMGNVTPPSQTAGPPGSGADAARAAVARTHAGKNPAFNDPGNSGAAGALKAAQAFGAKTGQTPQSAFNDRFQNSAPIVPGQQ